MFNKFIWSPKNGNKKDLDHIYIFNKIIYQNSDQMDVFDYKEQIHIQTDPSYPCL